MKVQVNNSELLQALGHKEHTIKCKNYYTKKQDIILHNRFRYIC